MGRDDANLSPLFYFSKIRFPFRRAGKKFPSPFNPLSLFARERQTASACPIGQNASIKFSSSLFEFFGGA